MVHIVDTNVIIRFLTASQTPQDEAMRVRATSLMRQISSGDIEATTTEVVLYETCWLLHSKRHYARDVADICRMMRALLSWPGWVFPANDLDDFFRAFEIWENDPKLEFSDSVLAARAERMGATLATFDRRLARAFTGEIWE